MALNQDIDIFGKENPDGTAFEYHGQEAVSNALNLWLSSKKGEFIYNPMAGGVLDRTLFRSMTPDSLQTIEFYIRNSITNYFFPSIDIRGIDIIPNYESRYLEITVTYIDPTDNTFQNVTIYTNTDYSIKSFDYQKIEYTGDNLIQFCQIKKTDMLDEILKFDTNTNYWTWGAYQFINLTSSSPEFEDILLICNGS